MSTIPREPAGGDTAAVAQLRRSLADLIEESKALRVDVHSAEQARRRANQINSAVLGLLAMFVAMLLVIGWQNNQLANSTSRTNKAIEDCSTPGRPCYEESRRRLAGAIGDVTRISVYVSQCARLFPGEVGPEYDRKLERCVAERLGVPVPSLPPPGPPAPVPSGSP